MPLNASVPKNEGNNGGSSKNDGVKTEEEKKGEHLEDDRARMGLCRQLCLCSGLMASDGGLVFLQLAMLPCLQTLGVPVSLVTVAGVISGSLALMGLPVLGWISDGGTNPHRRKKPAVVLSALVFVAGYSLIISGCVLRLRTAGPHSARIPANSTFVKPCLNLSTSPEFNTPNSSAASQPGYLPRENSAVLSPQMLTLKTFTTSKNSSLNSLQTLLSLRNSSVAERDVQTSDTFSPLKMNCSDFEDNGVEPIEPSEWMTDPLGVGIPLTGLLGILGFVFMDMGNDFNNSCLKSFVLTCTSKRQHNSVFVVGVLMSAVGGCVAAVLGVFDIAALLINESDLDAVPTKTSLQAGFFLVLTVVCMLVTLLSAPPFHSKKSEGQPTLPPSDAIMSKQPENDRQEEESEKSNSVSGQTKSSTQDLTDTVFPVGDDADQRQESEANERKPALSCGSVFESTHSADSQMCSPATPKGSENTASLLAGRREETEKEPFLEKTRSLEFSRSFAEAGDSDVSTAVMIRDPHSRSVELDDAGWSPDFGAVDGSAQPKCLDQSERQPCPKTGDFSQLLGQGKYSVKKTTMKMILVCVSMFFMAGAWQSFNICATDYLGKVVYGGDPDADRHSQSHVAYQQGISTGSLGVLMLNIAYVAINLLQKKILGLIGPKVEYLLVCVLQVIVLLTLLLTDKVAVFFVAAVVYGLFRSVMYTVPFMLANALCQQASLQRERSSAKVGSTMALLTAMMPLSYVLVSTLTGPLIYATGDPASPLCYAVSSTVLAAVVFTFT